MIIILTSVDDKKEVAIDVCSITALRSYGDLGTSVFMNGNCVTVVEKFTYIIQAIWSDEAKLRI